MGREQSEGNMVFRGLSVSWGRDYNHPLKRYEYCVFDGENLVARQSGWLRSNVAKMKGLEKAAQLQAEKDNASC